MIRALCVAAFLLVTTSALPAADTLNVKIGYLGTADKTETISLLEMPPANDGIAGAQLAIDDNNTTGKFLNQSFSLRQSLLKGQGDPVAAAQKLADGGVSLIVTDLPADALLKVADAGRQRGLVFFNSGAIDDRLRQQDCRANVIHTAPSRAMLADGLAQYLVWKHWTRWLLVVGSHAPDKLFADALRRSAGRFGAKIVQERTFQDTGGARRTDSGLVQIQVRSRSSPNRRRIMMCWSRPTRARCLQNTFRTGPQTRGRSRARLDWSQRVGTRRSTNGARFSCKTGS